MTSPTHHKQPGDLRPLNTNLRSITSNRTADLARRPCERIRWQPGSTPDFH